MCYIFKIDKIVDVVNIDYKRSGPQDGALEDAIQIVYLEMMFRCL